METKSVYLPPVYDNILERLQETDYAAWERVQLTLNSLQADLFGYENDGTLGTDMQKLLRGGFLKLSIVNSDTGELIIGFSIWSYLTKKYKHIEDMEDDEFDIVTGMLEYFGRVN